MAIFKHQSPIPYWRLREQIIMIGVVIFVMIICLVLLIGFTILFSGTIPISHSPIHSYQPSGYQMVKTDFHSERFNVRYVP